MSARGDFRPGVYLLVVQSTRMQRHRDDGLPEPHADSSEPEREAETSSLILSSEVMEQERDRGRMRK